MGGAQPLAVTMNGGVCLVADVDGDKLERRRDQRYLDEVAPNLDAAIERARDLCAARAKRVRLASSPTPSSCSNGCSSSASRRTR